MKFCKKTFLIYLLIGGWNTLFGYLMYSIFTYLLDLYNIPFSYIYAYILGNIISITHAFLTYKYIVFKSKGNFWEEYKKCWMVYGVTIALSTMLLPFCVLLSSWILPTEYVYLDKYLGGIFVTGIVALCSFFGHRKITFNT